MAPENAAATVQTADLNLRNRWSWLHDPVPSGREVCQPADAEYYAPRSSAGLLITRVRRSREATVGTIRRCIHGSMAKAWKQVVAAVASSGRLFLQLCHMVGRRTAASTGSRRTRRIKITRNNSHADGQAGPHEVPRRWKTRRFTVVGDYAGSRAAKAASVDAWRFTVPTAT